MRLGRGDKADLPEGVQEHAVPTALWPQGEVSFRFHPGLGPRKRAAALAAMEDLRRQTCLRWRPAHGREDFVEFVDRQGCYSHVGRQGGQVFEELSLGTGCELFHGIVLHEMCHAMGFLHEQSRPDRDLFVRVRLRNVLPDHRANFDKLSPAHSTTLQRPYDYGSVMHYAATAFSANGQPTLEALEEGAEEVMGQRAGLSPCDVAKINALYNCPQRHNSSCPELASNEASTVLPGPSRRDVCSKPLEEQFLRPLHRLYLVSHQNHFYTTQDLQMVQAAKNHGYNYEAVEAKIAWTYSNTDCPCLRRLYRLYNRASVDHVYTTSLGSVESLVGGGWEVEPELLFCAGSAGECGATLGLHALRRSFALASTDHFLTTDPALVPTLQAQGWTHIGVQCYLWPAVTP